MVWSMLPGAHTLTRTRVVDVRRVERTGYANVHTLQGPRCSCPALTLIQQRQWNCCSNDTATADTRVYRLQSASFEQCNYPVLMSQGFAAAGNAIVDGIAASNHVIKQEPGLIMDDPVAWERLKYMVRVTRRRV